MPERELRPAIDGSHCRWHGSESAELQLPADHQSLACWLVPCGTEFDEVRDRRLSFHQMTRLKPANLVILGAVRTIRTGKGQAAMAPWGTFVDFGSQWDQC
jgi:hypothetical protein